VTSIDKLQSSFDEGSIFSDEWHDIRNGSNRDDRQKIIKNLISFFCGQLRFRQECADNLKRYSHSRQSLEGILRRHLRIHHSDSFWDRFQVLVMIGDNDIHSYFFGIYGFFDGSDGGSEFVGHMADKISFQAIQFF